jgi:DNA polymerase-4
MPVRWLFLDMNAFFASVEQQERPELRGWPVAVVPMLADTTCCIAASYEAKAYGIKTGTSVADAKRLCPHVRLIEAEHGPYREYHRAIVEVVAAFLPEPQVLSIDEMYCRLWDNERELSDALRLGEHIKAQIKAGVGEWLCCSVGLAASPFLAKVAAEMHKPNGLTVITDEDLPRKLFGLALRDFPGIGPRMEARFRAAGVTTTEQMYALSLAGMRRLWGGVVGERWWRTLRGGEVALPPARRRSLGHSHVLPPELRTPRGAAAVARRLLEKAAERLRHHGYHARALGVYARSEDGQTWERRARLAPCRDTATPMAAFGSLWVHPFPMVRQVGVVLSDLLPDDAVTPSLFDDGRGRALSDAVDDLNERLGRGTVTLASVLPVAHTAQNKVAFARIGEMD